MLSKKERSKYSESQLIQLFKNIYFRNDEYGKLENGIRVEFMITEYCNLNCAGCDHFSPVAPHKYMSLEELEICAKILSKKLPMIKSITLMGGEPLLHPNFDEVCKIIRQFFPTQDVVCFTNGLKLSEIKEKYNILLKTLDIGFMISTYPNNFDYEKLLNDCKNEGLRCNVCTSEIVFRMPIINIEGTEDKTQYYTCGKTQPPVFTIKDYKIYKCPFVCCVGNITNINKNINIPETEKDFLNIFTFDFNDLKNFCYTPNDRCAYCKENADDDHWLWHKWDNNVNNYFYSLKEYYLYDYETYEKITNDKAVVDQILLNPFYKNIFDDILGEKYSLHMRKKFLYGKIDIIIPYYIVTEEQIIKLKENLEKQTFIDNCNLIFISDNSPQEELVYDTFNSSFNCTFLKNFKRQGPGVARNLGLKYSFSEYVFFLDFDDNFISKDDLMDLYRVIEKKDYPDIIDVKIKIEDENFSMPKQCIKNTFLKIHKIYFPPFFAFEDLYFNKVCNFYSPSRYFWDRAIYNYNLNNNFSISKEIKHPIIYKFLSVYFFIINYKCFESDIILYFLNGEGVFDFSNDTLNIEQTQFYIIFLLFLFKKLYDINKNIFFNINLEELNLIGKYIYETIINDNFIINFNNHTTYSFTGLSKKIKKYLNNLNDIGINSMIENL